MVWPPAGKGNGWKVATFSAPPVVVCVYRLGAASGQTIGVLVGVGLLVRVAVLVAVLTGVFVAVRVAVVAPAVVGVGGFNRGVGNPAVFVSLCAVAVSP